MQNQKNYWVNKQNEVEGKFLELSESHSTAEEPKAKKRKRVAKVANQSQPDPFAKYAAKLQIEFFIKVYTY